MAATMMGITTEAAARPTLAVVAAILVAAQVLILAAVVVVVTSVVVEAVTSVAVAVVQTSKAQYINGLKQARLAIQVLLASSHFGVYSKSSVYGSEIGLSI